jgi:hypothetical protein
MAHNTRTLESDAEMFAAVLSGRNDRDKLASLELARTHLAAAYQTFLTLFAQAIAADHDHLDEPTGNERKPHGAISDLEIAVTAARRAKRFETR